MNFEENMLLRLPILSMNSEISSEEFEEVKYILKNMHLSYINKDVIDKYISRMKYRTNPLNAMVSENKVVISDYNKLCINEVRETKTVLKHQNLFSLSNRIIEKDKFFVYGFKEDYYILEKNEINFDSVSYNEVLSRKELDKKIVSDYEINDLIETGFFSEYLVSEIETDITGNNKIYDRFSSETQYLNISDKLLKKVGNIVYSILNCFYLKGLDEVIDYFVDKYHFSYVPLNIVLSDKKFLELCSKLYLVPNKKFTDYYANIIEYCDISNINEFDISSNFFKQMMEREPKYNDFDVNMNILENEGKVIINLDTEKYIKRKGSVNKFSDSNDYSINILSSNPVISYLTNRQNDKNKINYDYLTENGLNLSDIYIGYDKEIEYFHMINRLTEENISINLLSNVDSYYLGSEIDTIVKLSNINNHIRTHLIPKFFYKYNHTPRITVDNNIILCKEQWVVNYNVLLHKNIDSFKYNIENMIGKKEKNNFVYIEEDYEIPFTIDNIRDIEELYKKIKKHKKLIIKENIYEKSYVYINDKQYNNELIVSYSDYHNKSKSFSKERNYVESPYEVDILDKWTYFLIEIIELNSSVYKLIKELSERINSTRFYYLFFIERSQQQLRFRVNSKDYILYIVEILKKYSVVLSYSIVPYDKEICRYNEVGIENFETISYFDSKRTLIVKNECEDNINIRELVTINIIYYLNLFFENELNLKVKILEPYIKGKQNRETLNYYSNIVNNFEDNINFTKFNNQEEKFIKINGIKSALDFIHLSNIRLIGNNIEIEKEAFKYIAIYLKKSRYKNGNNK
ncbi:hypothetical protein HZY91_10720 [Facklamia sp. DSM 111018]|uniref:Thiopeptide-type bacteriocin biosynthesis domain-containing protein n=1 Tax=Facklamia lactis TaxID=2749967 RepID=A0ABS0LTB6_9LACT|nr:hypothetical protein [Facklamia lactis]MBG9987338.1 hypothetical protein [Facklamia lactis]